MNVPILSTPRLTLRGHRIDDLADSTAMWADPRVTRHIGGRPFTREETWSKVLRYVGHWALLGFGYWVVVEKASGGFVGDVGLADFERGVVPRGRQVRVRGDRADDVQGRADGAARARLGSRRDDRIHGHPDVLEAGHGERVPSAEARHRGVHSSARLAMNIDLALKELTRFHAECSARLDALEASGRLTRRPG